MKLSRARFLEIVCGLLLGRYVDTSPSFGAVGGALDAAAPAPRATFRMEYASAALFAPHLISTFAAESSAGNRLLVLARVSERPASKGVEQFSLTFHGAPGEPQLHGVHAFHHPILGAFDLFVAPVGGGGAQETVYEACFSRHVNVHENAAHSE